MFADVQVTLTSNEGISVPQTAVLSDEGANFVFQNWKENFWIRRDVAVGTRFGDRIEILSGLEPGKTIVTSGGFMLKSDILREKMGAGCAD
jgi:cobalt-zinc-cadmium efflux system membrane fusion protein